MNTYYTYAYLREDRTPYYIGKGEGNRAYYKRKGEVRPPRDKSRIIFLKQNLTEEEAFNHEIYMIAVFGRKDLGTGILHNRTNGGEGASGLIHTEETKRKMSEMRKGENNPSYGRRGETSPLYGKLHTIETKEKISQSHKGKILSEEHKIKISESKKCENNYWHGKSHTEETKRKMSEKQKGENNHRYGKKHSEEWKENRSGMMKGENNPNYGKNRTEETKRKLSQSKIGRKWWNNGSKSKMSIECPGEGWVLGRNRMKKLNIVSEVQ